MGAPSITTERLKEAAEARYCEGLPWNVCAERAEISDRHLRVLRRERDERWLQVVQEVQDALEDEALPAAIGCLVRMTARNDVAAAKALLDKWRATRLELTGAGGGAIETINHYEHLTIDDLAALATGGADGTGAEGGAGGDD